MRNYPGLFIKSYKEYEGVTNTESTAEPQTTVV